MAWICCCSGPSCTDSFKKPLNQWWNRQTTLAVVFSNFFYLWSCPFFKQQAGLPDNLKRSHPTSIILWFCENSAAHYPSSPYTCFHAKLEVLAQRQWLYPQPQCLRLPWLRDMLWADFAPLSGNKLCTKWMKLPCVRREQESKSLVQVMAERQYDWAWPQLVTNITPVSVVLTSL